MATKGRPIKTNWCQSGWIECGTDWVGRAGHFRPCPIRVPSVYGSQGGWGRVGYQVWVVALQYTLSSSSVPVGSVYHGGVAGLVRHHGPKGFAW